MGLQVLVTYATRYGSTEEVAGKVAEALRETGSVVEVLPVRQVRSLEKYDAVVLGAPLYMGRMLKDARQFLSTYRAALSKLPVALFVLGPVGSEEKDWTGARQQMEKELTNYTWLSPVSKAVLGGSFDPSRLGFPFKLIPAVRKIPASDARDWTAIRAWANEVSLVLHPVEHS
jgi:menaquinone-dependent protoporphyrinogen oxidase